MPTIDHMYEIKYRRDMTEVALAVGLNPPHVPEDGALDAILACVREVTRRAAEAQCDANYWQGRYEAVCEENDGLTARAERAEADRDECPECERTWKNNDWEPVDRVNTPAVKVVKIENIPNPGAPRNP